MINTYVGPMYSGKSAYLISTYKRIFNKDIVLAFKPARDDRDGCEIKSREFEETIPAIMIEYLEDMYQYIDKKREEGVQIRTIFIDEAQFLKGEYDVLNDLSINYGITFYIAGLDMTSEQKPFGLMPFIMAVSDNVYKIRGFCTECNNPSVFSYHEEDKTEDEKTGDDGYSSLCPDCLGKKIKVRSRLQNARKVNHN